MAEARRGGTTQVKTDRSPTLSSHPIRLTSRGRVVIPLALRRTLGLRAGSELQVLLHEGRLELVPVRPIREARGFLKRVAGKRDIPARPS